MGKKTKVDAVEQKTKEKEVEQETQELLLDVAVHKGLRLTVLDVIQLMGDENFKPNYEDYEQTPASVGTLGGFRVMRIVPASIFYSELAHELVALAQPIVKELDDPGNFALQVAQALAASKAVIDEEALLEADVDAEE